MKNFYSLFAVLTLVFAMCMTQGCAKKTQAVTTSPEVSIALSELRNMSTSVHFDFDKADLTEEAQAILQSKAAFLNNHRTVKTLIMGEADPRGTAAYNKKLGLRRAEAVKSYLEENGVDPSQIEIISIGEEKSNLLKHQTEEEFAEDRVDEFFIKVE